MRPSGSTRTAFPWLPPRARERVTFPPAPKDRSRSPGAAKAGVEASTVNATAVVRTVRIGNTRLTLPSARNRRRSTVARRRTGVSDLPGGVDEAPAVAGCGQAHPEDAGPIRDSHLRAGHRWSERVVRRPAGSDHELADTSTREMLVRCELREPLVLVVVAVQHHVGAESVQGVPEARVRGIGAVRSAREPWLMPVRQLAEAVVVPEVPAQPALLAGAVDRRAVRVEGHEVPRAEIEAVVAERRMRALAEVAIVTRRPRRLVLVVAGSRVRAPLERS